MFEQVRETGPTNGLILRADMKPLVHVDDGQFTIDVQNHLKAVRQRIFFKFDFGKGSFLAGGGKQPKNNETRSSKPFISTPPLVKNMPSIHKGSSPVVIRR